MNQFLSLGLSQPSLKAIEELGFESPTLIQSEAIPKLLFSNKDFIGLAQTGTGKTAAFGLPLIERIDVRNQKTQALILAPTRELCVQITNHLTKFAKYRTGLKIAAVYGGADISSQIRALKGGVHILIATPGRLRDMLKRGVADLSQIEFLVLDEADEMLNMGFREEIDEILENAPDQKMVWLFSATMSADVRRITKNYMKDPDELVIGEQNTSNVDIDHQYTFTNSMERYQTLRSFLDSEKSIYGIIFCRTRMGAKELVDQLKGDGYSADALHGDLSQSQRDRVMENFRSKKIQLLVATDVAARGIDVQNVSHVYHYNIPEDLDFYTHRSGRTGRAGKKGISLILAHPSDKRVLANLEKRLGVRFSFQKIPSGKDIVKQQLTDHFEKVKSAAVRKELLPLLPELIEQMESMSKEELIRQFAMQYVEENLKIHTLLHQRPHADFKHHFDFKSRKKGRTNGHKPKFKKHHRTY